MKVNRNVRIGISIVGGIACLAVLGLIAMAMNGVFGRIIQMISAISLTIFITTILSWIIYIVTKK